MYITLLAAAVALAFHAAIWPMSLARTTDGVHFADTYSCSVRKTCTKIHSCDEAKWYLVNCSWGGKLDGDGDGSPCENLCGSNN